MTKAGKRLIEGAQEAVRVARGEEPAASITVKGYRYVPAKQTSPEVSALAAKYLAMDADAIARGVTDDFAAAVDLADDLKTLAASCLSQDEKQG